jgi:hypothetical protein
MSCPTSAAEWITAGATVFAALGTVGAVIVALRQIRHQEKRSLRVKCDLGVIADTENLHVVGVRATNDGFRPVKVTMAYLMTDTGMQVISPFTRHSDKLPKTLQDGESAEVFWLQENLDKLKAEGSGNPLYAFYMDVLGDVYKAPYPGVKERRKGLKRKREYFMPEEGGQGTVDVD